jgi:hypothetical protein
MKNYLSYDVELEMNASSDSFMPNENRKKPTVSMNMYDVADLVERWEFCNCFCYVLVGFESFVWLKFY